jgi:uncharacterized protein (TIGR03067 family)
MHCAALILFLGALVADTPASDEAKKDLEKFQGTWHAVTLLRGGESQATEEEAKNLRLVIKGDKRTLTSGDETRSVATFKLDPSRKPKAIDITVTEGALQGRTLRGIYTFEGDTHKICLNLEGDERPTEFTSKEGDDRLLMVFKRAAAADKPKPDAARPANEELRQELLKRTKEDQDFRGRMVGLFRKKAEAKSDEERQEAVEQLKPILEQGREVDRKNTAWLKVVVDKHGWPGKTLVGREGAQAAWLLAQHADQDRDFQKKCLPLIAEAVKKGEAQPTHLAYLTDRVRVGEGKSQLYGTQLRTEDGKTEPLPIEDEANVDKRRKEVGLGPLADYLKSFEALQKKSDKPDPVKKPEDEKKPADAELASAAKEGIAALTRAL